MSDYMDVVRTAMSPKPEALTFEDFIDMAFPPRPLFRMHCLDCGARWHTHAESHFRTHCPGCGGPTVEPCDCPEG